MTLKGARQDANRINRYLRAAGLRCVAIAKPEGAASNSSMFWSVSLTEPKVARKIPNGLKAHRESQATRAAASEHLIGQLAITPVAEIKAYQLQDLFDTMQRDQFKPASIALERALLRQLFNHVPRCSDPPRLTRCFNKSQKICFPLRYFPRTRR